MCGVVYVTDEHALAISRAVILRKRSPSQAEGLPTKDLCITDDGSARRTKFPIDPVPKNLFVQCQTP